MKVRKPSVSKARTISTAAPRKRKSAPTGTRRKQPLKLPPTLLEGDRPAVPLISGPGQRYALGAQPPAEKFGPAEAVLPEAYGTGKLFLTARDPRWLYAHWDLTGEQLKKYNALWADRHLVVRIYIDAFSGDPFTEVHVHPESRNWFVHVGRGGTKYLAELCYYDAKRRWVSLSTSGATLTPPDSLAEDTSVRFETIPMDVPFSQLLELVKTVVREQVPLIEAIRQLRAAGYTQLPEPASLRTAQWTPAQERALAEVVTMDQVRRVWMGSLEITELIRRKMHAELASAAAAQFSLPTSPAGAISSISSPYGVRKKERGFWFNINAELIIYGATEPDALVAIGDREIALRPDGTFSYRFALPDGDYALPVVAVSTDGADTRSADLKFGRQTRYRGDVGAHPQDPRLQPPHPANVA